MLRNLRAEMRRRDITNVQLAKELGVCIQTMQNKLSGRSKFTLAEKKITCSVIGMEWNEDLDKELFE